MGYGLCTIENERNILDWTRIGIGYMLNVDSYILFDYRNVYVFWSLVESVRAKQEIQSFLEIVAHTFSGRSDGWVIRNYRFLLLF